MPLLNDGNHKTYEEFLADVNEEFRRMDPKPIFGDLWMEMMLKNYPSVGDRLKMNGLDTSGMEKIPLHIIRAATNYFGMFHGKGWYNQGNPNIYPGSGYQYFIDILNSD